MESASVKLDEYFVMQSRCIVCETKLTEGQLCEDCARRGLDSQRFVELFWEEA